MHHSSKIAFLLLASLVIVLTACEPNPPVDPTETSHFPANVDEILRLNCAISDCHGGVNIQEELDLSSWENMFEGSNVGAVTIPYSPDWSHVFQHMNVYEDLGIQATPVMPLPPTAPLSRTKVITIQDWINDGAPDYKGNYFWAEQEARINGKVFTLNANSDLVSVTDIESNLVMRMVPVGQVEGVVESPHFLQLSPDNQFFYLSLIRGGIVEKYRTDNYEFAGRVIVGPDPAILRLNPDGSKLLVSHWNDLPGQPKVSVINTADMSIHQQVNGDGNLIDHAHGIAATADFRTVYITAEWGNYYSKYKLDESGTVIEEEKFPLDPNSPVPISTQAYGPYFAVLSPDESKLFISCNKDNKVRVYNTANDALLSTINVGAYPRMMAADSAGNRLYVACRFEQNTAQQGSVEGCISVIHLTDLVETQRIYRVGHRPHGLAIDPLRRRLYVSSENTGGVVPPHHPIDGNSFPPGHYNVVDLNSLSVIPEMETQIAEFPNAIEIIP